MFDKKVYFLFIIACLFVVDYHPAAAFTTERYDDKIENKIIVTPAKLELKLSPGQIVNQKITVVNRLGRKEKIKIIKEGLIGKEGIQKLNKDYFPNSGIDWIETEIDEIYLDHGERVSFDIEIAVPKNINPGGYYAGVLAAVRSVDENNNGDNIQFINRVGTSILMSIPGKVMEDMALLKFLNDRKFYLNGPVNFFTEAMNFGNIHLSPIGEIAVYNFLGKKVAQIPLKESLILPGQSQKWRSVWKERWILGIYKAHLTMRYGVDNDKVLEKELKFWAFPIHILLLILALIYLVHKLIQKWQEKYEVKKKDNANC
jgi:hypothetical protein